MSFQKFCEEELSIKLPKPHKSRQAINLREYKDQLSKSVLSKDKKDLLKRVVELNGEFPIYNEDAKKFYMTPFVGKKLKAREVKSREDKETCGVLLNSMINEALLTGDKEKADYFSKLSIGWIIPEYVYKRININKDKL
jgi:hypothetical protein